MLLAYYWRQIFIYLQNTVVSESDVLQMEENSFWLDV